ncbi:hypothetical protein FACS189487_04250 [Campylobacterota bacterium]|nr:hypothetical protein FACS189487_04250 [Campylobacterota bacterium]
MKQYQLDTRLNDKTPLKALILAGDSSLAEIYADRYLKTLPADLSLAKLYYNEFDLAFASSHLSDPGLFNAGNLLIIRADKKLDFKAISALLAIVKKNSSAFMLLISETDDAKTLVQNVEKTEENGKYYAAVRLFAPKISDAARFLQAAAEQKGIKLDRELALHFLRINNNHLSFAIADLDKLLLYDGANTQLVDRLSAGYNEGDLYKLAETLIEKRPFYAELDRLLFENDEMKVALGLYREFWMLFMFACANRLGKAPIDFMGFMLPQDVAEAHRQLSSRLNMRQYLAAFELLSELELAFKGDLQEKEAFFYAHLIKLQTKFL